MKDLDSIARKLFRARTSTMINRLLSGLTPAERERIQQSIEVLEAQKMGVTVEQLRAFKLKRRP